MSNSPSKVKTKKNFYKDTILPETLEKIRKRIFEPGDFQLKNPFAEKESSEYGACSFELNHLRITFRLQRLRLQKSANLLPCGNEAARGRSSRFTFRTTSIFL
ncbi:hypothetical protein LEP1GSC168_0958 [Leptospira santarosai str. HAI134]|nr:hypothetical protein LEP1GSC168_0958 [Leptospira santarosai str. HAI134]